MTTDLESRLRAEAESHQTVFEEDRRRKALFTEAADALAAQGWIPCSDRLPQVGEWACVLADRASRAPVVSEAAVEAAGLAYEVELEGAVYGPGVPRESMRAALTAALPHLFAASHAKPEVSRGE